MTEDVRRLYEDHGRALLAYAASLLRNPTVAEDVLHRVFLKLLSGRTAIVGPPRAYLFRAVRNEALNHLRGQSREVEWDETDPPALWLESPAASEETVVALESALALLPVEQREVVVLHIWGQLTFEEASDIIGVPPNTAASRYRYGLAKLREIWRK